MTEAQVQRIIHLKLQGFSVVQISEMQGVDEREVRKLLSRQRQDSIFSGDAPLKKRNTIKL